MIKKLLVGKKILLEKKFVKIFGRKKYFWLKKILVKKNFGWKNFLVKMVFGSKKNLGKTNFWSKKILCQKFFGSKKFLVQKIFGPKKMVNKNFGQKKLLVKKRFWLKNIFGWKNFWLKIFFWASPPPPPLCENICKSIQFFFWPLPLVCMPNFGPLVPSLLWKFRWGFFFLFFLLWQGENKVNF